MGLEIGESIRKLEAQPPASVVEAKFALEYALVVGLDRALTETCWKLGIRIEEKQVTGLVSRTMFLRLRGEAGKMARLLRWIESEIEG